MRKEACWGLVLAALLLLAGCGGGQTAAEAYLAGHSEAELGAYFAKACAFTADYASPRECGEHDLFRFAVYNGLEDAGEWDAEQKCHFRMEDLAAIFDRYFVEWDFDPAYFGEDYDPATGEVATIIGFGGGGEDYEIMSARAVGEDQVEVRLEGSFNRDVPPEESGDPDGFWGHETVYSDNYVAARIVDGEARFISWRREARGAEN